MAPEYVKVAELLKNEASEIRLAQVDAANDMILSERFQIGSFPMMKLFVDGVPIDYNSGRTAELIIQWLKKKTGPSYIVLNSVEELAKFQKDNEVGVLGLFNVTFIWNKLKLSQFKQLNNYFFNFKEL